MEICGHERHESAAQEACCSIIHLMSQTFPESSAAVAVFDEEELISSASMYGNMSSFAVIIRDLVALAVKQGRPECAKCADAWQQLVRVNGILEGITGGCK